MASRWLKSLNCKSNAMEDVHHHNFHPPSTKTKPPFSLTGCRCANSITTTKTILPTNPSPKPPPPPPTTHAKQRDPMQPITTKQLPPPAPFLPTLMELPHGHSSRRVVEIIFSSSWSTSSTSPSSFPGEVQMLFKVRNPPRAVPRFEKHRAAVRSGAGPGDARCAVDGNEMMMFHVGSGDSAGVVRPAGGRGGVRLFEGSGEAHRRSGGGEGWSRGMMVCRVIAGRVRAGFEQPGRLEDCESVRVGKGELVVLDPRGVLPCFLIIYKV